MTRCSKLSALAALAASLACAHGPAPVRLAASAGAPSWPPSPAEARVRFVSAWPAAEAAADTRGWLARAVDVVVGLDPTRVPQLLSRPFGLAVRGDELLVADPDARRVLRLSLRTGETASVSCPEREWKSPMAVAFGRGEVAYVADSGAGVVLEVEGDRCRELARGAFERPTGLLLKEDRLYVVDPPRHRITVLSPEGAELLSFGLRGDEGGQLNFPTGIAAGPDGSLLVVDSLNFRVARFSKAGAFQGAFGEAGDGAGEFARPKAIASDRAGRSFVSDSSLDQILAFDAQGAFLFAFGASGSGAGQLLMPAGLAVAGRFVFVADSLNGRVAVYELLGEQS